MPTGDFSDGPSILDFTACCQIEYVLIKITVCIPKKLEHSLKKPVGIESRRLKVGIGGERTPSIFAEFAEI
jgi:hypothetical protein